MKIKESEKCDQYLNLGREQRKLWKMWVTVIPIVTDDVCSVSKTWKGEWKSWKPEHKSRPSKLQLCWDRLKYLEEACKAKKTYCH